MTELERGQNGEEMGIPWYLVLVLNTELVESEILYSYLTENQGQYPVSAIFAVREKETLPKSCRCCLGWQTRDEIVDRKEGEVIRQSVEFEKVTGKAAQSYFRSISGFRVRETGLEERIPDQADFWGCMDAAAPGSWR